MNRGSISRGCVLIVDDLPEWRKLLIRVLKDEHHVEAVGTYQDAVSAIETLDFDVAVLDVRLEEADMFSVEGIDLLRRIRERKPNAGIVILTGYPETVSKADRGQVLKKYKPDGFVVKGESFNNESFRAMIQSLVRRAKSDDPDQYDASA